MSRLFFKKPEISLAVFCFNFSIIYAQISAGMVLAFREFHARFSAAKLTVSSA
jgi:hypothetical protein